MDPSAHQQHHQVRLIRPHLRSIKRERAWKEDRDTRRVMQTKHLETWTDPARPTTTRRTEHIYSKSARTLQNLKTNGLPPDTTPRDVTGARPASVSKRLAHDIKQPTYSLDVDSFVVGDLFLKEADCFALGPVFPFSTEGRKGSPLFFHHRGGL